ncbi:DUF4190 domain-containing protein, partial [Actinomadura sp. KC345]|uniref:DUF4190 domain-containing protein n=1 Tax=Actinomadura sp. KC345 TaxID=2530371 RepID=UPI00104EF2A2
RTAAAALILGPLGLLTCGLTSIVGVVLGHVSYVRAGRAGGGDRGLALAGVLVAWAFTAFWLVVLLAVSADPDSVATFVNTLF